MTDGCHGIRFPGRFGRNATGYQTLMPWALLWGAARSNEAVIDSHSRDVTEQLGVACQDGDGMVSDGDVGGPHR